MNEVVIIDYGIGNVKSIKNAFEKIGVVAKLTRNRDEILDAIGVVLPGVGAFAHGMSKLNSFGLSNTVREVAQAGTPLLGICLGMQLLFSRGTEFGEHEGLNIIPGKVLKLPLCDTEEQKLPHVSWNELTVKNHSKWSNTILDGVRENTSMYFVHSFHAQPENSDAVLSATVFSNAEFCSTVKMNNVYGCQYHPEKSAQEGLKVISNFNNICKAVKNDRKA